MKKLVTIAVFLALLAWTAGAATFEELRALASGGSATLPEGTFVEGIVVSDFTSGNMGPDTALPSGETDTRTHFCIGYIQNPEGTLGLRVIFNDIYDNRMPLFSRVKLDLSGAVIRCEDKAYTIYGLEISDIEILSRDAKPSPKEKYISELTPEDLYTYVTLKDVEFASKEGSITNVYEALVLKNRTNANSTMLEGRGIPRLAAVLGGWLTDSRGDAIFLPVNAHVAWRRDWTALPKGVGKVSGIVVSESNPRYCIEGGYSLRIAGKGAIDIPKEENSSYVTVASWNWDDNREDALNLQRQGLVEWVMKRRLEADSILADEGTGLLSTTTPSTLTLVDDYNTRDPLAGNWPMQGNRHYSGLMLCGTVSDWMAKDAAVVVEASTAGFSGSALQVDFTWVAGDPAWGGGDGIPTEWRLAWSADGRNFMPLARTFYLRPMITKTIKTPEAAPGYVENIAVLPAMLLGRERIWLRLIPTGGALKPDAEILLRIGKITLKALKQ